MISTSQGASGHRLIGCACPTSPRSMHCVGLSRVIAALTLWHGSSACHLFIPPIRATCSSHPFLPPACLTLTCPLFIPPLRATCSSYPCMPPVHLTLTCRGACRCFARCLITLHATSIALSPRRPPRLWLLSYLSALLLNHTLLPLQQQEAGARTLLE